MNEDNACGPLSHLIYIELRQCSAVHTSPWCIHASPLPSRLIVGLKLKVSVLLAILPHNSFSKRMKSAVLLTQKKTKYRGPPH